mmetsp:Transcript_2938/g.6435  ORF Transcript_2938/g.6435 Transcript_2938/m.6435 type:complete len:271 (+) Transcript_2938:189-1001(+)
MAAPACNWLFWMRRPSAKNCKAPTCSGHAVCVDRRALDQRLLFCNKRTCSSQSHYADPACSGQVSVTRPSRPPHAAFDADLRLCAPSLCVNLKPSCPQLMSKQAESLHMDSCCMPAWKHRLLLSCGSRGSLLQLLMHQRRSQQCLITAGLAATKGHDRLLGNSFLTGLRLPVLLLPVHVPCQHPLAVAVGLTAAAGCGVAAASCACIPQQTVAMAATESSSALYNSVNSSMHRSPICTCAAPMPGDSLMALATKPLTCIREARARRGKSL